MQKKCPICNNETLKVIYYGLPGLICENENCNCAFGFSFWLDNILRLPYNGCMMVYRGNYFIALWEWLKNG